MLVAISPIPSFAAGESIGGKLIQTVGEEKSPVEGVTIVIVTHSMQQAARVSQRTAYFHLGKLVEVVDKYEPDLMWFDSWLNEIPDEVKMQYLAYYFNKANQWGKDVVVTFKQDDLPREVAVDDYEKGRASRLTEFTWLTDDTISRGSWCYTQDLRIKPTSEVVHVLIDIVSKNGNLLLNVGPMADGTIPEIQRSRLVGLGDWLVAAVLGLTIFPVVEVTKWLLRRRAQPA